MAITNSQYQSILRTYEEKQRHIRRDLEKKTQEIFEKIPEYKELCNEVPKISAEYGRALLSDHAGTVAPLKQRLKEIASRKKELLQSHGYPLDYLEPAYECTLCKDTGFLDQQKCQCFQKQITSILYEQSNIRQTLERENFSTLSYDYYEGEALEQFSKAVEIARRMVDQFAHSYENLFLFGTVGTGKSFLSGCIAKEVIEAGFSVIYFSATGLFDTLSKYAFDTKSKESLYKTYEDLYNCDLMIIDDLGTELSNQFVNSQLFSLLNERHIRRKSTIISTNLSLEEVKERYSDKVLSRIVSNYNVCKLSGKDIRIHRKIMSNRK